MRSFVSTSSLAPVARGVLLACVLPLACNEPKDTEPAKPEPVSKPEPVVTPVSEPKPVPPTKAEPPKPAFKKGRPAPPGLSPDDIARYAEVQGDPHKGKFTLEEAFAGDDALADPEGGTLWVTMDTDMGKIECELFEKQVPMTVANFVGLGRGVRATFDKKADKWEKKKVYDGVTFHRVVKSFMVQTGDPSGTGTGDPGFVIPDEIDKSLKHNKAGILSMANRGPNTGSSQFFVTVRPTPHLDGRHAVFGQCPEAKVAIAISEVKVDPRFNNRPVETVRIKATTFSRRGGKKPVKKK